MKVLVTGGAGFIGSHLVEALLRQGARVRVLDNFSSGKRWYLTPYVQQITLVEGDILDPRILQKVVKGVRYVFHQAALHSVPRSLEDPRATNEVNIRGTLELLLAAQKARVKRFIFASSSSVYGDSRQFPQREDQPTNPVSPYAVSKLTGEYYCSVFTKTMGLETVSLRYFNVFGPRQDPHSKYAAIIASFILAALQGKPLEIHGDGKQSRDFTYVMNVVQANLAAAAAPRVVGQVINVACGKSYSVLDIAKALEAIVGQRLPRRHTAPRPGDVRKTWADVRRVHQLLHCGPTVSFLDGLRKAWEYFCQHRAMVIRTASTL
ncbi:MAG: SDR family oxidoreductase [Elusimicrobia bacterium]|nr:SDR family oxidoreductase [Elusimicrobiota bacterium]